MDCGGRARSASVGLPRGRLWLLGETIYCFRAMDCQGRGFRLMVGSCCCGDGVLGRVLRAAAVYGCGNPV